ncbi:MAG: hypothetical protein GXY55_21275 [Phycisphaerae bacterium]|nr:hypothetical protein [Phycisphaerae bacterium]
MMSENATTSDSTAATQGHSAHESSVPASQTAADYPAEARRDLPGLARRVLIIGLDGATFDILRPLMDAGRMPHLARLVQTGTAGILESTKPPITPAAWTTFMTGMGPGRHGIVDFEKYDVRTNTLSFNSTYEIREKTIWEMLSEKGFRVGSINLPMTYPPRKVNGFVISGFETPSIDNEFTYPADLKREILQRWPDYSYRSNWQRKALGGEDLFKRNAAFVERSFHQGGELVEYCGDKYGWDVLMVLFKLVDNLQHKAWRYLDPKTAGQDPHRAEIAAHCFEVLDEVLGKLSAYAERHEATLLIMSDHGHGSLDGKAQPNALLEQWGYLKIKSRLSQAAVRARRILDRLRGKTTKRFAANLGIEHDLALDWSRTRACVIHAGMYGFLYVSLKGRQPNGLVEPADYEPLREELRQKLLAVTSSAPDGRQIQVFSEVARTEELYGCRREDQPWLPDLLLIPQPGLAVVRKIRGGRPVLWSAPDRLEGTHRVEGILIANGPGVRQGHTAGGRIADIAPTLLAALGLRVPSDMEGRVLADLFEKPPTVEFETPQQAQRAAYDEVYDEAERDALTRRLSDLGYLE